MVKKVMRMLFCCFFVFTMLFATACEITPVVDLGDGDRKPPVTGDDDGDDEFVDWTEIDEWTPQNIKYRPVDKSDILIGSYVSFCDTAERKSAKEQVKVFSNGGLNFMPLAYTTPSFGLINSGEKVRRNLVSLDWWKKLDDLYKENNMLYYFSTRPSVGFDNETYSGNYEMTSSEAIAAAAKIVPELDNCIGYHVVDEPSYGAFSSLASVAKKYAAIVPGHEVLVNHLPMASGYTGADGYYGFMKSWVTKAGKNNINILSHDNYPFGAGGTDYLFLSTMNDMRQVSVDIGGIPLGCFLQSSKWEGRRMPDFDEIKWSMNAYLANGFSRFMYFNYTMYPQENCSDAIIGQKGNILHKDLYDSLSAYHRMVRAMSVNTNFTDLIANTVYYTANFAGKPSKVGVLPASSEYIKPDGMSTGEGFIVSYLTNKNTNETYMMIVNNSFTKEWNDLSIKTGSKANDLSEMALYDLETGKFESLWQSGDTSFTLSFGKGDMKMIKLTNK